LIKAGLATAGLALPFAKTESAPLTEVNGSTDWKKIRKAFPISKKLCYLNNGTMGPSPMSVIKAIESKTMEVNTNLKYHANDEEAKTSLAKLLGTQAEEIALTHNVTEGINIATWAFDLRKGDEVILTDQEHVGNALPWLNRQRLEGIVIRSFHPEDTAEKVLAQVKKLINPKTKVIAIPHIPCTTGQVYPIKEICEIARNAGVMTLIDGAHGAGMLNLNLKDLGCDIYSSCCHKWLLGPKGTGFMYVRKDLIENSSALFVGGHSDTGWTLNTEEQSIKGFQLNAHRYHYGTQNYANFYGINEAVNFNQSIGTERIANRIVELNNYLFKQLKTLGKDVQILTPEESRSRAGIATIKLLTIDNSKFISKMRNDNIILRYLPESGHNAIRISTHIYNDFSEIDRLIFEINKAIA